MNHTHTIGTMREFNTKNFRIVVDAIEDNDLDLSFDNDRSVIQGLDNGTFIAFTARVIVYYRGRQVGSDYLGSCIYKSFEDFMDHKKCGKQNRRYAKQGKEGRCGSYFSDMIHVAISAARETLLTDEKPYIRH